MKNNIYWISYHVDGLMQDCSNSIANTLELLQSCTKLSILHNPHGVSLNLNNSTPLNHYDWFHTHVVNIFQNKFYEQCHMILR